MPLEDAGPPERRESAACSRTSRPSSSQVPPHVGHATATSSVSSETRTERNLLSTSRKRTPSIGISIFSIASSSVVTSDGSSGRSLTWRTYAVKPPEIRSATLSSALLSDGLYNYIYGNNDNIPIAQIDISDGITTDLLPDASDNVRGLVEVSSGALHPFEFVGYCDYDTYGTPMTSNGGSTDPGGLDNEGEAGDPIRPPTSASEAPMRTRAASIILSADTTTLA